MDTVKRHLAQIRDCQRLWQSALLMSVIAILYLATTSEPYPVPSSANDKVNHLIAFAELTVLARLGWPRVRAIWFVPALIGFGFLIEGIQSQLPYREFSLADVAADAAGIAIGLLPWPGLSSQRPAGSAAESRM